MYKLNVEKFQVHGFSHFFTIRTIVYHSLCEPNLSASSNSSVYCLCVCIDTCIYISNSTGISVISSLITSLTKEFYCVMLFCAYSRI